jgi:hypothetical protein
MAHHYSDDDCTDPSGSESDSSDDQDASNMSFVTDDSDPGLKSDGSGDSCDSEIQQHAAHPLDGMDVRNIITGQRVRLQAQSYDQQVFRRPEVQRLILEDTSPFGSSSDDSQTSQSSYTSDSSSYTSSSTDSFTPPDKHARSETSGRSGDARWGAPDERNVTAKSKTGHSGAGGGRGHK